MINNKDLINNILSRAIAWYNKPCIYFLIKNKEIVYVGQTTNLFNRLGHHQQKHINTTTKVMHSQIKKSRTIDFDSFSYIECDKNDLDRLEGFYIFALLPKLNRANTKYTEFVSLSTLQRDTGLNKDILIKGLGDAKQYVLNNNIYYKRTDVFA